MYVEYCDSSSMDGNADYAMSWRLAQWVVGILVVSTEPYDQSKSLKIEKRLTLRNWHPSDLAFLHPSHPAPSPLSPLHLIFRLRQRSHCMGQYVKTCR